MTPPSHLARVPLIPLNLMPDKDVENVVSNFEDHLRTTFGIFLRDDVQLPLWQPPKGLDDKTQRHITDLKIPIISSESQLPLLLLHNLGQPSHDARLLDRLFTLRAG